MKMEEKLSICELLSKAAHGYDERKVDMLERCFTEDAVMTMRISGGDIIGPFIGKENIMKLHTDSMGTQTDQRRHVITNIFFEEPSEDKVTVVSNLSLFATENGKINILSAGVYRDEVVRENNTWYLRKRHLDLDLPY